MVVEEPRQSSQLNAALETYVKGVDYPHLFGARIDGAILFGICRGKISEVRFSLCCDLATDYLCLRA